MSAELTTTMSPSTKVGTSPRALTAFNSAWLLLSSPSMAWKSSPLYSKTIRTFRAKGLNALSKSLMIPSEFGAGKLSRARKETQQLPQSSLPTMYRSILCPDGASPKVRGVQSGDRQNEHERRQHANC